MMEALAASGIDFTVFFHNPNIHPREEYEKRKHENIRYAEKLGIPFVEAEYDTDNWFRRVKGLENEAERGARCTECFSLRLERTALYAHEHGFPLFTSSLGVSRWKNLEQVNECGHSAAAHYADLRYWDYNWRKFGASDRRNEIITSEGFYEQEYCGCVFSHRAANERRNAAGRPKIGMGPGKPQATDHTAYTVSQKSAE
jgi:predicted adenine nucleotide alpha hydrolase (AANH) superfamily ATPase